MKTTVQWVPAVLAAMALVITCAAPALFGPVACGAAPASSALTASASVYLPYIVNHKLPTPTPTPMPPGVHILPNHYAYVDLVDYLHIVGEVQNNTSNHLRFVRISANIYDSTGRLLDTDYTYIYLDNLPAGDKTCFDILLRQPVGWSYYQFEAPSYWTDGKPLPHLTVTNHSGAYDPTFQWYEVIGQVRNDHGTRVEYVSPVGTLYDESGTVLGCHFTFVNSTHLDPGQTSAFKIVFSGRDYVDVASYRLQVDGTPK